MGETTIQYCSIRNVSLLGNTHTTVYIMRIHKDNLHTLGDEPFVKLWSEILRGLSTVLALVGVMAGGLMKGLTCSLLPAGEGLLTFFLRRVGWAGRMALGLSRSCKMSPKRSSSARHT